MTSPPLPDLVVRRRDVYGPRPEAVDGRGGLLLRFLGPAVRQALPLFRASTDRPVVALTYDDGPHPVHTSAVLDALREHGARATFFVLAGPARRHPDLLRRMVDEGHEVGVHGEDHTRLTTLPLHDAVRRVLRARRDVERAAGVPVQHFRPPYGAHGPAMVALLRARGLESVIWTGEGNDWENRTAEDISRQVLDGVFPGSVVLLHDDRADPGLAAMPEELPRFDRGHAARLILDGLRADGYRSVTVAELRSGARTVRSYAAEAGR